MSDITAHFDGTFIVPDIPLTLPAGQRLRVNFETIPDAVHPLTRLSALATDLGIEDLSERLDDYCYGPGRESSSDE